MTMTDEQRKAWEVIKPLCVEVECVEGSSFQGGDEDCYVAGIVDACRKGKTTCYVFNPEAVPPSRED